MLYFWAKNVSVSTKKVDLRKDVNYRLHGAIQRWGLWRHPLLPFKAVSQPKNRVSNSPNHLR
jgi:hypothetical protein